MVEINKIINKNKINKFSKEFEEGHNSLYHEIYKIPAGFTLLDAVSYIFDDNINYIADFLNKLNYKVPFALEISSILEDGIGSKSLCLTCLKNEVMSHMR